MESYKLRRIEVTCLRVKNDGSPSDSVAHYSHRLDGWGFNYTIRPDHIGVWNRKPEAGVTFDIMLPLDEDYIELLGSLARAVMPDQEAIQVVDAGIVTVWEA